MVYHQGMIASLPHAHIRVLWILLGLSVLAGCAPTGEFVRGGPQAIDGYGEAQTRTERRVAESSEERADGAVRSLRNRIRTNTVSTQQWLSDLAQYRINEIRWQLQTHRDDLQLRPWLELALMVHTQRLNPSMLDADLSRWARAYGDQLPSDTIRAETKSWVDAWRAGSHGPQTIGIILPGDSALSTPGEAIKDGILDAWLSLDVERRPELFFYYVDDDQPQSLYQVPQSAIDDGVDWLVGPLPRTQVEQILKDRSARWMTPTLFLNVPRPEGLRQALGNRRLAFALSPEDDARQAAIYARQLGLERALVLEQNTAWGQRMGDTFVNQFRAQGGRVIEQASYNPMVVDHSDLLESVLGLNDSKQRIEALQRLLGEPLQSQPERRTDIDMIFLASRAADARQIRPQLQFFRAEDLPVIATAHAVDGSVDGRRDVDLEGLYLPMPPWFIDTTDPGQERASAEARHQQLSTPALSHLYAMGRDLTAVMRWLGVMQHDPDVQLMGMTGTLSVSALGEVERELTWVQIEDGQSVPQSGR
ncbi:MAG TPA: penicillin-binding protein activator [Wenzhouxiangella sp.]